MRFLATSSVVAVLAWSLVGLSDALAAIPDYSREIRPILAENCFACHGFDAESRKGGLRLDTSDGPTTPADSGQPAVTPGNADLSELVKRVRSADPSAIMPPHDSGKKLKPEQIEKLAAWVAAGAPYARHWSFEKPALANRPAAKNAAWPTAEFDWFILDRLEREGLAPSPVADKATLARRAALDLIGLPAEPDARDAFLKDDSPQAFERYVDKLLDSPRFGERWARHWLDIARYADTKGYEKDLPRPLWRWRDWVVAAINADMPYDQFTREQLAGDLLPNATRDQILATAFHRNTMSNDEGGTDDEEFRLYAVKDRVDTTMQAWMGLTFGCAKCHSHKYDPIAQREYYQFMAYFNQTEDADRYDDQPKLPTPTADEERRQNDLRTAIASVETKLKTPTPELDAALAAWEPEAKSQLTWTVAKPATMLAASGSTLSLKDDGSILAQGDAPARELYVLRFPAVEGGFGGVKIEAIPDPANPRGGVGRSKNDGNFVLSSIRLAVRGPDGKLQDVPFVAASADYSQESYPIEAALKGGDKNAGWAVSPKQTEPHTAVFGAAPRTVPTGAEWTLTLTHDYEHGPFGFSLGRWRVSTTAGPASIAAILETARDARTDDQERKLFDYFMAYAPAAEPLRKELADLKNQLAAIVPVDTPIMRELPADKRRPNRVHKRGNFLDPGEDVQPASPSAFPPFPADAPQNRLGVAQWLVNRDNPLTARVAVNRMWAHLFGRGLVETEEDFGATGVPPTHPEALDALAIAYMDSGWSLKKTLKTIVLSSTYRQSAQASPELVARDRDNRLFARGPRFRLEAEMIRDQALAVSGLLSPKIGGPSVFPYQPDGLWRSTYNKLTWKTSDGEDRRRRGIYTFVKRTTPYPQMITFDGSSRETCQIRRPRTNTPLQALTTLNDPAFVECAQALGRKMAAAANDPRERIAFGIKVALGRDAKPSEIDALAKLYAQRLEAGRADPAQATKFATEPLGPLADGADPAEFAALTAVANVLLNLDEFLTKG